MDIMLPDKKPFGGAERLVQARSYWVKDAVREVFRVMAKRSYESAQFETGAGLNWLALMVSSGDGRHTGESRRF